MTVDLGVRFNRKQGKNIFCWDILAIQPNVQASIIGSLIVNIQTEKSFLKTTVAVPDHKKLELINDTMNTSQALQSVIFTEDE